MIGTDGETLASLKNRNRGASSKFSFEVEFADALGVEAVRVLYMLDGEVQLEVPNLPFRAADGLRLATSSVGEGEGETGSAHVIRRGGRYVVVADSDDATVEGRSAAGGACSVFTVLPPVEVEGGVVCADWIEVEPLGVTFPSEVARRRRDRTGSWIVRGPLARGPLASRTLGPRHLQQQSANVSTSRA